MVMMHVAATVFSVTCDMLKSQPFAIVLVVSARCLRPKGGQTSNVKCL